MFRRADAHTGKASVQELRRVKNLPGLWTESDELGEYTVEFSGDINIGHLVGRTDGKVMRDGFRFDIN